MVRVETLGHKEGSRGGGAPPAAKGIVVQGERRGGARGRREKLWKGASFGRTVLIA